MSKIDKAIKLLDKVRFAEHNPNDEFKLYDLLESLRPYEKAIDCELEANSLKEELINSSDVSNRFQKIGFKIRGLMQKRAEFINEIKKHAINEKMAEAFFSGVKEGALKTPPGKEEYFRSRKEKSK